MLTLNGVTRALVGQESGRYGANHIEDKTKALIGTLDGICFADARLA